MCLFLKSQLLGTAITLNSSQLTQYSIVSPLLPLFETTVSESDGLWVVPCSGIHSFNLHVFLRLRRVVCVELYVRETIMFLNVLHTSSLNPKTLMTHANGKVSRPLLDGFMAKVCDKQIGKYFLFLCISFSEAIST